MLAYQQMSAYALLLDLVAWQHAPGIIEATLGFAAQKKARQILSIIGQLLTLPRICGKAVQPECAGAGEQPGEGACIA